MDKVFIYWDNSNLFIGAQQAAAAVEGDAVRYRVRLDFRYLLELAAADRDIEHAIAVGSVPPELRHVWNRLENQGVTVQRLEPGPRPGGELQTAILRDALDYKENPGTAVLTTGDGAGFADGVGFHADLERMRRRGWRIEVLSWRHSCNRGMREWAEQYGVFIALDDFYDSVTFLAPPIPGQPLATHRDAVPPDLSRRPAAATLNP